jgi:hypothetical protein
MGRGRASGDAATHDRYLGALLAGEGPEPERRFRAGAVGRVRRPTFIRLISASAIVGPTNSRAQAYPTKSLTIVASYSPGGSTDTLSRILAEHEARRCPQGLCAAPRPYPG